MGCGLVRQVDNSALEAQAFAVPGFIDCSAPLLIELCGYSTASGDTSCRLCAVSHSGGLPARSQPSETNPACCSPSTRKVRAPNCASSASSLPSAAPSTTTSA